MSDTSDGAYTRLLGRLERSTAWDRPVGKVAPLADRLVTAAPVRRVVDGDVTGTPLHVVLTDVPFGAWFMAQYLDLFGDDASRRAATRLLGLGAAAAVPTALSGWARWAGADPAGRRVGMTHASLEALATVVFAASWAVRLRGHHRLGIALARLGSAPAIAGGFLGGHLGSGRHVG